MMIRFSFSLVIALVARHALAEIRVQTFDNAPQFESSNQTPFNGGWGWQQDGICNTGAIDCSFLNPPPVVPSPVWNSEGFLTPIGIETQFSAFNRFLGSSGATQLGPPLTATSHTALVSSAIIIYDNDSWGDVSTATHVTLDVKGSYANTGGITLSIHHNAELDNELPTVPSGAPWWTWAAGATADSVGANPGNATEWTTLLIPIKKPLKQEDGTTPHEPDEEATNGNWGTWVNFATDEEFVADWDATFSDVNMIEIFGLAPDAQIDNLGFVLPDAGLAGDFDADDDVDGADFLEWQRGFGTTYDADDLTDWQDNYGMSVGPLSAFSAVPEPSTGLLLFLVGLSLCTKRCNKQ